MCLSLVPVSASATTSYLKGDINNDGVVNGTDSLALRNFLNGTKATSSGAVAERLDVNQNGIIDVNDYQYIRDYLLGINGDETITSKNTTALPTQSTKYYYTYNTSGNQVDYYAISPMSNISTNSTGASTYSIIGNDTRDVDYSKSGVVKLEYNKNGNLKYGTGFVVGKHTILTAAHCVYDVTSSTACTNMQYTLYNADGDVIDTYNAVNYHVPAEYVNCTTSDYISSRYDYAIITVSQDLSNYMCFDLGVPRDYIATTNPWIKVTGFSGTHQGNDLYCEMATGLGRLIDTKIDNYKLYYNVDMVKGQSGGPVYIEKANGQMTVIGINIVEDVTNNVGKRIDTNILNLVYNYDKYNNL